MVKVTAGATPGTAATAYRAETASVGALGDKSLKDTPYSMEVFTRDLMDNKQATSLNDITKGDASITPVGNRFNAQFTNLTVRGIQLDMNAGKIDGLNFSFTGSELPLEHFESVEILKGVSGFLYGFGEPGGGANYISKRPTAEPKRSLTTQLTDSGTLLLHGDVGGRFGADGRFGYRVNLVNEEGDTYVDDGGKIRRRSGSLALDWRLTPDLVWRFDTLYQKAKVNAALYALIPNATGTAFDYAVATPPDPINGRRRIASPFTYYENESSIHGTELVWRLAPQWEVRLSHRQGEVERIVKNSIFFARANGDYAEQQLSDHDRIKSEVSQAMISGKFATGVINHDLTFGALYDKSALYPGTTSASAVLGTSNLANPGDFADPSLPIPSISGTPASWSPETIQRGIFASDTLHFGERWDLILGLRYSSIKDSTYDKSAATPTLAVVFRPVPWLSTYASYIEALQKGNVAPTTAANAGRMFEPMKSKQAEIGVKAEGRDWSATAAVFRLNRALTYTTADNVFTQDGEARYDGFELSAKARLSTHWMLNASTMLLDAKNIKTDGGTLDGKRVAGTPRQQITAYVEYTVPGTPLVLNAGVQHYGKKPLDAANVVTLPAYTLFDLGARYSTRVGGTPTTLRLNVDNVTDKAYWLASYGLQMTQGAPRTVKLSAQFEF